MTDYNLDWVESELEEYYQLELVEAEAEAKAEAEAEVELTLEQKADYFILRALFHTDIWAGSFESFTQNELNQQIFAQAIKNIVSKL